MISGINNNTQIQNFTRRKPQLEKFDENQNGTFNLEEFQKIHENRPEIPGMPEINAEDMFKKIDADGDNEISKDEMKDFHKNHKPPKMGQMPPTNGFMQSSADFLKMFDSSKNESSNTSTSTSATYDKNGDGVIDENDE